MAKNHVTDNARILSNFKGGIKMTEYIILERIKVENANCIAGFTYGFPAITAFLGFEHLLSRQFNEKFGIEFEGCAVFCHDYQLGTYKDFYTRFIQSRNPPSTLKGKNSDAKSPAPIIEEGKMNMTVSVLLRCRQPLSTNADTIASYINILKDWVYQARLAGGSIKSFKSIDIISDDIRTLKSKLLPCFVLLDATALLKQHYEDNQQPATEKSVLENWTDFFALKEFAKLSTDDNGQSTVIWERYVPPNKKGWIVPLMIGYKAISPLYDPNTVENLRDTRYPFRFVEAVHGLGEWRSLHRIADISDVIWQYQIEDNWYLCRQLSNQDNLSTTLSNQPPINQNSTSEIDEYFGDVFDEI
jgi:CRISPR-associated protein Csy2